MAFRRGVPRTTGPSVRGRQAPPAEPPKMKLVGVVQVEQDKHQNDVATLLFHNDALISGADDGKIKVWSPDLTLRGETQAHPTNVYSLAVVGDTLYSCGNDGVLKAWDLATLVHKADLLKENQTDILKLRTDQGKLFAGNDQGDVHMFVKDEKQATYSLQEDIADFLVLGTLVFNARNTDVSVTEMTPGPRYGYMSRGAMIGRFPIRRVGDKVLFLSRSAKSIYVHASTKELRFRRLAELKGHEMTITSMCGLTGKDNVMLSGGYDRVIRAWDLQSYKRLGQLEVSGCVNALCPGPPGQFFFSSSEGFIGKIDTIL